MLSFFTVRVMAYICAGLGIVIAVLGFRLWAQDVQLGHMANERDAAVLRVTQALQTIDGQKKLLQECSDQTKALKAEGDKRQADADAAVAKARTEAGRYQQEVKRLRGLQSRPTPSGADCRTALREIRAK